jgi:hypothetical protein
MTEFLLVVIAICVLALLALVFRISMDLRLLRIEHVPEVLAALRTLSRRRRHPDGVHHHFDADHHFVRYSPDDVLDYLIWEWRDASWHFVGESKTAGTNIGLPPSYPGSFTGERVKTWTPRRIW